MENLGSISCHQRSPSWAKKSGRRSNRWQEIDRIENRNCGHTFLRTKIKFPHTIQNIVRQGGCTQISWLHGARPYTALCLDRDAQHNLAAQGRIVAQLTVIYPVECGLISVEDDLDIFISTRW